LWLSLGVVCGLFPEFTADSGLLDLWAGPDRISPDANRRPVRQL
jgi:hypothetical protein